VIYFLSILFSRFPLRVSKKEWSTVRNYLQHAILRDVYLNEGLLMEREGVTTHNTIREGTVRAGWTNYSQKRRF